ncbi:MAG TPA: hypothetical protein EYQ74_14735 [Planctomycetes bacterium]|nr:hypothetical protein [Planctomycetota bacterium]HIK61048.1 hypothetical protein [Planctomycetota bacterium]
MNPAYAHSTLLLLALFAARGQAQDEESQDPPALVAVDGKPIAPGRIPDGTRPEAQALWHKFTSGDRKPAIKSFDLSFEAQIRQPGKFNEIQATIRFLQHPRGPFLDASFAREDRRSVRGPRGDFLVEEGDAQPMVGLDFEEDRRSLDRWCALSSHFITLSQPERIRLISLEQRDLHAEQPEPLSANQHEVRFEGTDPLVLPSAQLAQQARGLKWLDIQSPDFRLYETRLARAKGNVQRALLGLDPATSEVRMAMLSEAVSGAIVLESALLILVPRYQDLGDTARVPAQLEVREVDPRTSPWTFQTRSGTTIYLKRDGRLNPPDVSPATFIPGSSKR